MMHLNRINDQFSQLEKECAGTLGISAVHIESGLVFNYNAEQHFLMCSTYKIPIAISLLNKIESGEISLVDTCEVHDYDLRSGAQFTLNLFDYSIPMRVSIRNLLQFMMQESCNTSTDILLRLMGGPKAVTRDMLALGFDIRVERYTLEILADWEGIKKYITNHHCTLDQYHAYISKVSDDEIAKARLNFKKNLKDITTPAAMTQLLIQLFNTNLLNPANTQLLLDIMMGCKLGQARLKGMLPSHIKIAHKTGTLSGYVCDVGIITLPHSAGNIALSVYIKDSKKELTQNERVLSEIGRTLYDFFTQ